MLLTAPRTKPANPARWCATGLSQNLVTGLRLAACQSGKPPIERDPRRRASCTGPAGPAGPGPDTQRRCHLHSGPPSER